MKEKEKNANKANPYDSCKVAERKGWNLNDLDTYTGIDKIGLLIPIPFISIDSESKFLKTHRQGRSEKFVTDGTTRIGRIYVKKLNPNFNSYSYSLSFSLSRLFNGVNVSSYTPLDVNAIKSKLDRCLKNEGFHVRDWDACHISMIEIFRNIILSDDVSEYTQIFRTLNFPRLKNFNYMNTTYFQTKRRTIKISIYDKGLESMNRLRIKPKQSIMRVEFRIAKKSKVTNLFKQYTDRRNGQNVNSNLNFLPDLNLDKLFTDKMKILLGPLLEIKNHSIVTSNLESELQQLYANNRNGNRLAKVSTEILSKYQKGLLDLQLNKLADEIIKPSIRANASPDREERVQRKAQDLLSNAVLMNEIINHGHSRIDELINGLLSKRPDQNKIA
ncbi:hypothetical protein [Leptospira wolffii]|uniref:hypothetical protein n=1 Tax=Leptospira wolffii TaxID=409998 RepID=UPI0002E33B9B|nr:hypothetical protein [Leptospira wolffii]EPG64647.1 hypothetical protein LEP1GSC061_0071 [Leptospira wolffii serovar Khorat str. Khorat-H2]